LDAPIERVTAIDIPMPYAKNLEEAVVPGPSTIIKAVRKVLQGVRL
jgi:pyruvate dehydrogenase E1 component beta subunit